MLWRWNIEYFLSHRESIEEQIVMYVDEILLPYRIVQLRALAPDTRLPMPVAGISVRDIGDSWGAARSEGRVHEGIDIFAERGTAILSSTAGYVIRTGYGERGGLFVFVLGSGGRRYYYAHMDRIAWGIEEGERVENGITLGYVGNTGNAESTPPHLHFGVYVPGKGPINPFPLLLDR